MINSIIRTFELRGDILVPGEYVIKREPIFGEHTLGLYNSGNKAGIINVFNSLHEPGISKDFSNHNILSFSVYDDGKKRFSHDMWKDPNELLHVALTYDATPCRTEKSVLYLGLPQTGIKTVLVFNKTLDSFVQDPEMFDQTLDMAANNKDSEHYFLERARDYHESH